jgi:hypothetical protein
MALCRLLTALQQNRVLVPTHKKAKMLTGLV